MKPEENILFKGISDHDRKRMIECFNTEIKNYTAGQTIVDFSGNSERIGIVLKGNAVMERFDINGTRTIADTFNERGVFGLFYSFNPLCLNNAVIKAVTNCEIMFINRTEITKRCEKACECHSMVVENLLSLMCEKATSLYEHIEVLSQRTIEDKLINFLTLVERKTSTDKSPEIPFSTTALSDYLCVNRSALQRVISKLKKNGVISISNRKFRLLKKY